MTVTLPDATRVWIYQADRPLNDSEIAELNNRLASFAEQWVSHSRALRAHAEVRHGRFLVLMVDETQAGASGCSIDASVHFLKQLEQAYGLALFDRMTFAYRDSDGRVRTAAAPEFGALYKRGEITDNTPVFDNLVKTKGELDTAWVKPLGESWHARFV